MSKYKQKFSTFDIVKVSNKMPKIMEHFPCGFEALVIGSYYDRYWKKSNKEPEYMLMPLEGEHKGDTLAWYNEYLLTFVRKGNQEMTYDLREEFENSH